MDSFVHVKRGKCMYIVKEARRSAKQDQKSKKWIKKLG